MSWLDELQDLSGQAWWTNLEVKPLDRSDRRMGWLLSDGGEGYHEARSTVVQQASRAGFLVSLEVLRAKPTKSSSAAAIRLLTEETDADAVQIWETRLDPTTGEHKTSWNRPPGAFSWVTETPDFWRVEQMCLVDDAPSSVKLSLMPAASRSPQDPYDPAVTGAIVVRNLQVQRIPLAEAERRAADWAARRRAADAPA